jgi:hypothetical protein
VLCACTVHYVACVGCVLSQVVLEHSGSCMLLVLSRATHVESELLKIDKVKPEQLSFDMLRSEQDHKHMKLTVLQNDPGEHTQHTPDCVAVCHSI